MTPLTGRLCCGGEEKGMQNVMRVKPSCFEVLSEIYLEELNKTTKIVEIASSNRDEVVIKLLRKLHLLLNQ
jgi:hypothetical protein